MNRLYKVLTGIQAGVVTLTEAASQLEILLARQTFPVDVNALARDAVGEMGDVFYDADPQVDGYGVEGIRSNAASCVANAINQALLSAFLHCAICGNGSQSAIVGGAR